MAIKQIIYTRKGINYLLFVELNEQTLLNLANENINKGLAVPGVQKKMSMHLAKEIE